MADDKAYKAALKNLDNLVKKQQDMKKSTDALKDSWGAISSELFKISGAQFFKQIPRTAKELREMSDEVSELTGKFNEAGDAFANAIDAEGAGSKINKLAESIKTDLGGAFKGTSDISKQLMSSYYTELKENFGDQIKDEEHLRKLLSGKINGQEELLKKLKENGAFQKAELEYADDYNKKQKIYKDRLSELKKQYTELNSIKDEEIIKFAEILEQTKTLENGTLDWKNITKDLSGEQKKLLAILHSDDDAMLGLVGSMNDASDAAAEIKDKMLKPKEVLDIGKSFGALGSRMRNDLVGSLMAFDTTLHKVQKDSGIMMVENSKAFSDMTTSVAQFGMSVEEAGQMMGQMGQELQTTDFSVLSKAAQDFSMIEGATGAASEDITTIAGELMRAGESSEEVKDFMQGADQMARNFGISSKKAIGDISKNIKKMRTMGFVGGEESLKKMVMTANRLRMNVDEIFDVAKKARTIEGAMDMAAELQLAGGSFANINPMDLLAAARKGPVELQKILTGMGKDVGHWVTDMKGNKKYEFNPVDTDKLQMVADATGQTLESIQNGIQKNAEDTEKLNPFQGVLDGMEDADKELAKSGLSQMLKVGKNGAIEVNASSDMAKRMGVKSMEDLQSMTGEQLKEKMLADQDTLEKENERNQDLKQSFDNFMKSLLGALSILQPILEGLGWVFQKLSEAFNLLPNFGKYVVSGLLAFGLMFSTSVGKFIVQGIVPFFKAIMNPKKALMSAIGGKGKDTTTDTETKGPSAGVGDGFKSLAEGLKAMGDTAVFKGILAVALAGPALLLFVPALPGLLVMGLIGNMREKVTDGFKAVADGIDAFGQKKNIFKGILAVGLAAIPLLLFTLALPGLLAMALIGAVKELVIKGFEAISNGFGTMGSNLTNIAKGTLALILVSVGLIAFGFAAQLLAGLDLANMLGAVVILGLIIFGLIVLGQLMMGPQILFLLLGVGILIAVSLALMIVAENLLPAAQVFNQLGAIDWSGFSEMGGALGSVVPGMLAFSLAAMMFMNPIALIGIMFMVGALAGLVSVMAPLAASLTIGADSISKFADGIDKLSRAADKLSLEKLEKLKELSDSMAGASSGGAVMASMAGAVSGGGGAGGGEVRKIEVDVKINGRTLNEFIVKDTAILK